MYPQGLAKKSLGVAQGRTPDSAVEEGIGLAKFGVFAVGCLSLTDKVFDLAGVLIDFKTVGSGMRDQRIVRGCSHPVSVRIEGKVEDGMIGMYPTSNPVIGVDQNKGDPLLCQGPGGF